jgi:SAM-dependent methyltransferase
MLISAANMEANNLGSDYALGSTDSEHERLIRQAARFAPFTERLFRDAGVGRGQRVLDLGSGMGDVAMLVARIVSPSGEVVGVERDARSITRAQKRVSEAGLSNVSFVQCDASELPRERTFDAAVGRLILPTHLADSSCRLILPTHLAVSARSRCGIALRFSARSSRRSDCLSGAFLEAVPCTVFPHAALVRMRFTRCSRVYGCWCQYRNGTRPSCAL